MRRWRAGEGRLSTGPASVPPSSPEGEGVRGSRAATRAAREPAAAGGTARAAHGAGDTAGHNAGRSRRGRRYREAAARASRRGQESLPGHTAAVENAKRRWRREGLREEALLPRSRWWERHHSAAATAAAAGEARCSARYREGARGRPRAEGRPGQARPRRGLRALAWRVRLAVRAEVPAGRDSPQAPLPGLPGCLVPALSTKAESVAEPNGFSPCRAFLLRLLP